MRPPKGAHTPFILPPIIQPIWFSFVYFSFLKEKYLRRGPKDPDYVLLIPWCCKKEKDVKRTNYYDYEKYQSKDDRRRTTAVRQRIPRKEEQEDRPPTPTKRKTKQKRSGPLAPGEEKRKNRSFGTRHVLIPKQSPGIHQGDFLWDQYCRRPLLGS